MDNEDSVTYYDEEEFQEAPAQRPARQVRPARASRAAQAQPQYEEQYAPEDQYLPEEQYAPEDSQPAQPVQKPRQPKKTNKKKSLRRRYGQIALISMAAALVLLILLLRVTALNRIRAGKEEDLESAYDRYTSGETSALEDIRSMAESYTPAQIALNLIEGTDGSVAASDAEESSLESFGDSSAEAADTTTETEAAATTPAATDTTAAADTTEDSSQEAAEPVEEDADVTAARQLWDDGKYSEAMTAFDKLADEGKLTFDVTNATSGDEVLAYGAVSSMLSLYKDVSTTLYYSDAVLYVYTPVLAAEGYDFDKPVYYFTTTKSDYVCAYNTSTNRYTYWSDNSETLKQVISGTKYDLVSISKSLDIRKMVQ